jgi:hypothetical protein
MIGKVERLLKVAKGNSMVKYLPFILFTFLLTRDPEAQAMLGQLDLDGP